MTEAARPTAEPEAIAAVVDALRQQLLRDYPPGTVMRRDAHPKAHGCVQAEVFIHHRIPHDCQHGVFARPGVMYPAWIRFSNGFGIKPDLKFDTRGMAVKLLGVAGPRLPTAEGGTQDFVAATHDAFFVPDAITYVGFPEAAARGPLATLRYFLKHGLWHGLQNATASSKTLAMNPLAITYFSQVPYRLGGLQVKFKCQPLVTDSLGESLPWAALFKLRAGIASAVMLIGDIVGMPRPAERLVRPLGHPDLLRRAMARSLTKSDAWFELLVQRREGRMSIEDATDRWDDGQSLFQSVAWIRIPRQVFSPSHVPDPIWHDGAAAMERICEHLSFSPWNGVAPHEPLGSINRARRLTYESIATLRHEHNAEPRRPPTDSEFAELASRTRLAPGSVDPRPVPGPATRRSRWWQTYFRRVPLLTAFVALVFPIASVVSRSPLSVFFKGVFDVSGARLFGVALLTSLLAYTVLIAWWVITAYGDRRFRMGRAFFVYPIRSRWYLLSLVLALPTAVATWIANPPPTVFDAQAWAFHWIAGMALSLAIVWSVRWSTDFIGGLPPVRRLARLFLDAPQLGDGYVDTDRGQFLPGQLFALGLVSVTVGIALMLGQLTIGEPLPRFGALQFALVLTILVSSFLSAATFFFDRFNLPIVVPLFLLACVLHDWGGARHYFALRETPVTAITPYEVLSAPRQGLARRVVVVTASGGGAQAALWTAKVLTGLTTACRRVGCQFDTSVAMVSGTSGGAVGAMHVARAYENGTLGADAPILAAAGRSTQSSLWRTLLYKDAIRPFKALWPAQRLDDRGVTLERAWEADLGPDATLSGWQEDARRGRRPGVIFSSTVQTTGDLLLVSTAGNVLASAGNRPVDSSDGRPVIRDFMTEYGHDAAVVTGARLSASFPVVTPIARDNRGRRPWRIMDGGLADVYGVEAALAWLHHALAEDQAGPARVEKVMVLQVRTPQPPAFSLVGGSRPDDHLARDERGIWALKQTYANRVEIVPIVLELHDAPAVAWHLTSRQRRKIDEEWQAALTGPAVTGVFKFLGQ